MKPRLSKHIITNLLILLFISVKLTGLHTIFHDSEKDDTECSICLHHISHSQTAIALPAEFETIEVPNWDYILTVFVGELPKVDYKSDSQYRYFSRPPPSLI